MIIRIITQNRLYPEFELGLIFKSAVKIVVVDIIKNVLRFASPIKREILIQKIKNLLNNEKNSIIDRTIWNAFIRKFRKDSI
jgi:hypothetical protein